MADEIPTMLPEESARLAEAGVEQMARARAAADPLPGALSDAFLKDSIKIADGVWVRRVVASDWKILKALDSPIFRQMLEFQKPEDAREETVFSDEEQWEMCWQFTHTPKENRELIAQGRKAYAETAETWADSAELSQMPLIIDAITKQLIRSFQTSLQYGDGLKKKD